MLLILHPGERRGLPVLA